MAKREFGLAAAGNALVDVLAHVDEAFVAEQARLHGMKRGAMNMITAQRGRAIHAAMGPATEMSGGSAANSLSGFASFGGKGAFMGKVAVDAYGDVFASDMHGQGIVFSTPRHKGKHKSGRSYILVTPDRERTMNTYLGASTALAPADIDGGLIASSRILLLEGYLFDAPSARKAFMKAAKAAKEAGTKVAFSLSDHELVTRHHAPLRDFVLKHTDILIGNEKEFKRLTCAKDFEMAARRAQKQNLCETLVMTLGGKGALIIDNGQRYDIAPVSPLELADTTGAGDAFAAGLLYGLSEGMTPDAAGLLGARAASRTIGHIGARQRGAKFSDLLL